MNLGNTSEDVISISTTGEWPDAVRSEVLLKSDRLRVVRIVMAAGACLKEHSAPGDLLVQCCQGKVAFSLGQKLHTLEPGQLIFVPDRLAHAVEAIENAQLLLTIALDS
ncbi:cupin domain-containing protein [Bremerella cremea]|uniref:Cupin domain-containing protein n=1 Tax=Bremerella cremea TaxID=1031537 RepID=A0A368KT05_9BACT|nr:cupin domain-containing protein [Bremerella cremea]RCS48263.1 cupin domain-containing protein [Bremerella cremea]